MIVKFRNGTSNILTLDLLNFFFRLPEGQEQYIHIPTGSNYEMETDFIEKDLERIARKYCNQNNLNYKTDFYILVE
jgi:hypothetical protein